MLDRTQIQEALCTKPMAAGFTTAVAVGVATSYICGLPITFAVPATLIASLTRQLDKIGFLTVDIDDEPIVITAAKIASIFAIVTIINYSLGQSLGFSLSLLQTSLVSPLASLPALVHDSVEMGKLREWDAFSANVAVFSIPSALIYTATFARAFFGI